MTASDPLRFDLATWSTRVALAEERRRFEARAREIWDSDAGLRASRTLESYLATYTPDARFIVGPSTIAIREQLVAELAATTDLGAAIPTDVFVWGRGEPPRREATKYGGLPYWPADRPWPERGDDVLCFVGQLAVHQSRELFQDAPGDLLLLFIRHADEGNWMDESILFLEWVDLTDAPLVDSTPPDTDVGIRPIWAQAHRTNDYPELAARMPWEQAERLGLVTKGTKIGGARADIQPDAEPDGYRAAFGSVSVSSFGRWPYLDVETLTQSEIFAPDAHGFGWGDMGSLFVHTRDGRIVVTTESY